MTPLFRQKAVWIMRRLLDDFDIGTEDAAAIAGNAGHESGGFKFLQEIKPVVKGSRGGTGWFMWTASRRVAFEAWCKRNKLKPASDAANYGFLVHELRGPEKHAIPAVKKAATLPGKTKAFEVAYERAGVKHYPSRYKYAADALEAFLGAADVSPAPDMVPPVQSVTKSFAERLFDAAVALLTMFNRSK